MQIDEAIDFMKSKLASVGSNYVIDQKEFDFVLPNNLNINDLRVKFEK